jgi:superfamily II DNA/RNA helicase
MKRVLFASLAVAALVQGWVSPPRIAATSRHVIDHQSQQYYHQSSALFAADDDNDDDASSDTMGLNELQTLLRNAAKREDYMEAGRLSDLLVRRLLKDGGNDDISEEALRAKRYRMSWQGLGTAPWLEERLDALNFTFPTTVQINAMEAVNAILNVPDDVIATTTLEERMELSMNEVKDMGIVISGNTGAGKTLAYLVPLLSTLSDSLFVRQRLRVGAEERILGDKTADFVARVMAVTAPQVRSSSQQTRQGGIATGAALSTLGRSGKDVTKPLVLIVVPTKELGVQIAMLLYQLVGGTIRKKAAAFTGKASMFKYKGPKGVKIGCVLGEEEAAEGLKLQTDVAITTPEYLSKLLSDGDVDPSNLRVIVYDEADLALEQTNPDDLDAIFNDDPEERPYERLTFLVGASVTESLGNLAVSSRVLPEGKSYMATAKTFSPLGSTSDKGVAAVLASQESTMASLQDLDVCMDPGLRHMRVITGDNTRLLTLTKLLRKELDAFDKADGDETMQRPRVVVFFPTEEEARAAIEPIRDALWGKHQVCVLLPKTGFDPMRIMEEFTDGKTNLMIATPNSVRGLDFPELTHVYAMYLPFDDPREYVHLAGRVGRVGQMGSAKGSGGRVVAILKESEVERMDELAKNLDFTFTDIELEAEEAVVMTEDDDENDMDIDKMRRYLEDTLNLVSLSDNPSSTTDVVDVEFSRTTDDDDEDDDDDDDDDDYDDDDDGFSEGGFE